MLVFLLILLHVSVFVLLGYLLWDRNELITYIKGKWEQKELKKMNGNDKDLLSYEDYLNEKSEEFLEKYSNSSVNVEMHNGNKYKVDINTKEYEEIEDK